MTGKKEAVSKAGAGENGLWNAHHVQERRVSFSYDACFSSARGRIPLFLRPCNHLNSLWKVLLRSMNIELSRSQRVIVYDLSQPMEQTCQMRDKRHLSRQFS